MEEDRAVTEQTLHASSDVDPKTADTTALAYLGDAVYEIFVRENVIASGQVHRAQDMNRMAVRYVRADSQAACAKRMIRENFFTKEEAALFRRARNRTNTPKPRGSSPAAYKLATGFEAVLGWLYLTGNAARLSEVERQAWIWTGELYEQG